MALPLDKLSLPNFNYIMDKVKYYIFITIQNRLFLYKLVNIFKIGSKMNKFILKVVKKAVYYGIIILYY